MKVEERLVKAALGEPVELEDMKAFARCEGTGEDGLWSALITAARQWCEGYTKRVFMRQSWDLILFEPPASRVIELPKVPLLDVSAMHFEYDEGQSDLWPVSHVVVHDAIVPGRIVLKEEASWPFIGGCEGRLRISYDAGYGDDPADVPEPIRLAIRQLALHWYEQRELASEGGTVGRLPLMAEALLAPYRVSSLR